MTWSVQRQQVDRCTVRVTLAGESPLSVSDVLRLWRSDGGFRSFFTAAVCESGFDAYFWEMPPVTLSTLRRPFEFVIVDGVGLARLRPDPRPFSEHFTSHSGVGVLSFPNLSGDATLIVPAPVSTDHSCYSHLGSFLRSAPVQQVDQFWQTAAAVMQRCISTSPVWLSTAGMGVSWLHLRLDSRPKYYRHQPYKMVQ